MRSSRIIAIDAGASHVAGGVFTVDAQGKLTLQEFASETLLADPLDETPWTEPMGRVFAAIAARVKHRGAMALAVPGHLALTKFVKTPAVAAAKRGKIVQFEAAQNIPYPLEQVAWTHRVVADDGLDLEIALAAVKLDTMEELCAAADSAGFKLARAWPAGFALCEAFRINYPLAAGPALVADIGARSTHLVIIEAGRFFARTLAIGGNAVTAAVAAELQVDFAQAEKLKLQVLTEEAGLPEAGPAGAAVRRATEHFINRLQIELTRSMVSYGRQVGRAPSAAIYLTGGGSRIPELPAMLAEKFKLPVEYYDPFHNVHLSAKARASGAEAAFYQLASLVGLAWSGDSGAEADPGLLPPAIREGQAFRRRQPLLLGTVALAAFALLQPIWHYHRLAAQEAQELAELQAQLAPMQAVARRNADNLAKIGAMQKQIAALQGLVEAKSNWMNFLADLQERLTHIEDVWLDQLTPVGAPILEPAGPVATAPVLHLRLSGRLLDPQNPVSKVSPDSYARVQQLLAGFTGSPFITAIENERFDNAQPGILRFDFTLVINPQHPL